MSSHAPQSIQDYLDRLREALAGADAAIIQDALYDAQEHLHAEMSQNPGKSESEVLGPIVSSYGSPGEIAEIYLENEDRIRTAMRTPRPQVHDSPWPKRFVSVFADPQAYLAALYLLLALLTGIFYFTTVVSGLAIGLGLSITIVGIPLLLLVLAAVRLLALVEGRIVEACLDVRMPRRPRTLPRDKTLWDRIKRVVRDGRTWTTLLYMLLQLPLGITYFAIAITSLSLAIGLILSPVLSLFGASIEIPPYGDVPWLLTPVLTLFGMMLLGITLHLTRWLGGFHGALARRLLVQAGR